MRGGEGGRETYAATRRGRRSTSIARRICGRFGRIGRTCGLSFRTATRAVFARLFFFDDHSFGTVTRACLVLFGFLVLIILSRSCWSFFLTLRPSAVSQSSAALGVGFRSSAFSKASSSMRSSPSSADIVQTCVCVCLCVCVCVCARERFSNNSP